jgi:LysR family transcriptional regulator for metE and metH
VILEVRHLRVVDAIQREGTVTRAAARLHLTQPAVSHALRDLEDRLGIGLFRRQDGRMVATPEGKRILRAADSVLGELRRAEEDIEQARLGNQGVVRIATECYTCYNWLPALLRRFGEEFPAVELQIAPEEKADPMGALLEDRLDLAILSFPSEDERIVTKQLFQDEMVAIVATDHPLADRHHLTADDFRDQHLINHGELESTSVFQRVLRPAGVTPARVSAIPLTEAIIQTVRAGIGISVIARWLATPEVEAGQIQAIRVTPRGLRRTWYAAIPSHRADAPAIRKLVKTLKEHGYRAACECVG